jgi:basic membrane protein A
MGKNRKPLFVLSVVMVIGMVMGSVSSGLAADKPRIAIVFATGGLGDKSFNDSAYEGMLRAEKELGIEFDQAEPQAVAEYESLLMRFAQTRRYDLIISIGFDQADALQVVSGRFPDQKFAIVDTAVDAPNVASYVYREAERGFVVGAVAGLMTKRAEDPRIVPDKQIIGVIGGMDIPLIRANVAGYIAGAKFANPEVEVKYSYVGDWADPAKCKEMANAMLDEGVDVIWLAAGRSGLGGIMAAEERNRFAIGAEYSDNTPFFPLRSNHWHNPGSSLCLKLISLADSVCEFIAKYGFNQVIPGACSHCFPQALRVAFNQQYYYAAHRGFYADCAGRF